MDPVSALVTVIIAALGIVAAVVPIIVQGRNVRKTRTQELYRDVSAQFLGVVEMLQLELDTSFIAGVEVDGDRYRRHFWELETSRARLEILVPGDVRVWAYRVRLAIEATKRVLEERRPDSEKYLRMRCLLHTARAETVANMRIITSAKLDWSDDRQSLDLDKDGRPDAHRSWLKSDPHGDSMDAVKLAIESMKGRPFRKNLGNLILGRRPS